MAKAHRQNTARAFAASEMAESQVDGKTAQKRKKNETSGVVPMKEQGPAWSPRQQQHLRWWQSCRDEERDEEQMGLPSALVPPAITELLGGPCVPHGDPELPH